MFINRFLSQVKWLIKADPGGFIKTIWFNFRYLPFSQAYKLPVFISSCTQVKHCHRSFYIGGGKTGDVTIGLVDRNVLYKKPCSISVFGTIQTHGDGMHAFGPGAIIIINKDAELEIGNNFAASHDLRIKVYKHIVIGDDNMWSYYNVVMDGDGHPIMDENRNVINPDSPIVFGNKIWMGCRCTILKGVSLADNTIIASTSVVTKSHNDSNNIISSYGKTIKTFGSWKR